MVNYISGLVFVVLALLGLVVCGARGPSQPGRAADRSRPVVALPDVVRFLGDPAGRPVGKGRRLSPRQVSRHEGPGPLHDRAPDRSAQDGRHPRADGQFPPAAGHHPRQRAGHDRRRALLPRRQRRRGDHHGAGLSLHDHPVFADLASRRHRPDDARPALDRAGRDRQVDRAARREGHQGLGPGSHRLCEFKTSTCPKS